MKARALIYDRDENFVKALGHALGSAEEWDYQVIAVSEEESALRQLSEGNIALFLVEEEALTESIAANAPDETLALAGSNGTRSVSGLPAVFKYQPCAALARSVRALLQKKETHEETERLSAFVSIGEPDLCCMASLIAGLLEAETRKTAWMSVDPFPAVPDLLTESGGYDLSDLCYEASGALLSTERGRKPELFGNLYAVAPSPVPEDALFLTPDMTERCFRTLRDTLSAESLVVDLSFRLTLIPALRDAGTVYLTVRSGKRNAPPETKFLAWIGRIMKKTAVRELVIPDGIAVPKKTSSPDQLLFSEFGEAVRKTLMSESVSRGTECAPETASDRRRQNGRDQTAAV